MSGTPLPQSPRAASNHYSRKKLVENKDSTVCDSPQEKRHQSGGIFPLITFCFQFPRSTWGGPWLLGVSKTIKSVEHPFGCSTE